MTFDEAVPVSVIPGQLSMEPEWPKVGSVKSAVLHFLMSRPEGSCRRDFGSIDIFEVASRIGELRKDGWVIHSRPCSRHSHRSESHFVEYII